MSRLLVFSFFLMSPALVCAQVYKCVENGSVVFSDYPCQRSGAKTIDVKPATGGPVNRSSEYWEETQRKEREQRARAQAERAREDVEYRKLSAAVEEDRRRQAEAAEAAAIARRARLRPSPTAACSPSNPELSDFKKLDGLVTRFDGVLGIAESTSRIALSGPLLRMNEIKVDASYIEFKTDCLKVMKENALFYMTHVIEMFKTFSAGGSQNKMLLEDAALYRENYRNGKTMYRVLGR